MRLGDLDALKRWFEDMSKYYSQFPDIICQTAASDCRTACEIIDKAETIDVEPVAKWVSVEDELPEQYKAVLGYTPYHNNIWALTMHEDGKWYIWCPGRKPYDPDWDGPITHWCPLPKPPKEANDE